MTKTVLTAVALTLISVAVMAPQRASAQSEVLAEMYGRGVHAYYAGDYATATQFLTMAIDNGTQDPRAFYFRGLVSNSSGQAAEAESDWTRGAELEAVNGANAAIGRSLSRFQGVDRLKLETIRQQARLSAMATAAARSQARYGEIKNAEAQVLRKPPQAASPVTPPPVAPGTDDPFTDDMATGAASVDTNDALKNAMENPFAGEVAIPAGGVPPNDTTNPFGGGTDAGADPFSGGTGAGEAADPFGSAAPAAGAADPFGSAAPAGAAADPFGGTGAEADPFGSAAPAGAAADPFGGAAPDAGAEADPFGGNPFDN